MEPEWFSTFNASGLSVCLIVQIFILVRFLWRVGPGVVMSIRQKLCYAAATFNHCYASEGEEQEEDARLAKVVGQEVDAKRVKMCRTCVICLSAGMSTISMFTVSTIARQSPRGFTWNSDVIFLLGFMLASALVAFPALTKARSLNMWHCTFMLLLIVYPFLNDAGDAASTDRAYTLVFTGSIFASFMNLNIRVSFFTNLIYLACALKRYSGLVGDGSYEDSSYKFFFGREFIMFLAKVGLLASWQFALVQSTQQQIEAKSVRGHKSAVTSLLGMVCDSVVELDEKMAFIEHVPSFANSLFHGNGKSLRGELLQRFLYGEEDKELFESSMHAEVEGLASAVAQMFHAQLRDAWGNPVHMEMFHIPFVSVDDRVRHLVGLKEHVDGSAKATSVVVKADETTSGQPEDPDSMATILEGSATLGLDARLVDTITDRMVGQRGRTRSRRSGSRSRSSKSSRHSEANEPNAMQIDILAISELPITYASQEFRDKYGKPETLSELIPDPMQFTQWINSVTDEVFSGARLPSVQEFGDLTMRSSSGPDLATSEDAWSIQVMFPSPGDRETAGGETLSTSRSSYTVGVRLAKPYRSSGGTAASTQHQAFGGESIGAASPGHLSL